MIRNFSRLRKAPSLQTNLHRASFLALFSTLLNLFAVTDLNAGPIPFELLRDFEVSGRVYAYNSRITSEPTSFDEKQSQYIDRSRDYPEPGTRVSVNLKWRGDSSGNGYCNQYAGRSSAYQELSCTAATNRYGQFTCTFSLPTTLANNELKTCRTQGSNPVTVSPMWEMTASVVDASEAIPYTFSTTASTVNGSKRIRYSLSDETATLRAAPHLISSDGHMWARKYGRGSYPIVFIEGYDAQDNIKTGAEACEAEDETCQINSLRNILRNSLAGERPANGDSHRYFDYLVQNGYSLWVISNGNAPTRSMKGSRSDFSDGQAYGAMELVHKIKQQSPHNRDHIPIVVGGYSLGGLIARAGVTKWCNGTWDNSSVPTRLKKGCEELSLWYAFDSPHRGAHVPVSLQRYIHHVSSTDAWRFDNPIATELLSQTIKNPSSCNTGCGLQGIAVDGCKSYRESFSNGCEATTDYNKAFLKWMGSEPPRRSNGDFVPALGLAMGMNPSVHNSETGAQNNCPKSDFDDDSDYLENEITLTNGAPGPGDHFLFVNTAFGYDECGNGSRLNSLNDLHGRTKKIWPINSRVLIDSDVYPTFMRSTSALDVCSPEQHWAYEDRINAFKEKPKGLLDIRCHGSPAKYWIDYWYNDVNANHLGPMPAGGTSMALAWITEYSKGRKDKPICGHPLKKVSDKNRKSTCRPAIAEIPGNQMDDDGDELVDEIIFLPPGGSFPFPGSGGW